MNHKKQEKTYIKIGINMKGRIFMPNYRGSAMPYNNYRQMPTPACSMGKDVWSDKSLAMAYVPWQTWRDIYEADKGFHYGTIFKELNMPFVGKRGVVR